MSKKVYIKTWGCQMNEHDSQVVEGLLRKDGYTPTDDESEADLIFLNTCSVREKAENKLYSQLGRYGALKEHNPDLKIAVGGCVAQQERGKIQQRSKNVDLVVGTHQFRKIGSLVREISDDQPKSTNQTQWIMGDATERFDEPFWQADSNTYNAMITVMEGCDQVCSFCIVPFTRGREISRPAEEVVQRARQYAEQGITEVMLLGQNVNAYGKKEQGFPSFPQLLHQVCAVDGIERVRFTSPHPQDFSEELAQAYQQLPNLCPHAHIPLQAGNNDVLRAMKRSYTKEVFIETVERLRQYKPDIYLSTDIIVGFPGETEDQFEETLELMELIQFDQIFSFVYSPRPFTPARKLDDPVPLADKKEWLQRLQALQKQIQIDKHQALIGTTMSVMLTHYNPERHQLNGRSMHSHLVHVECKHMTKQQAQELLGSTHEVTIDKAMANSLTAVL